MEMNYRFMVRYMFFFIRDGCKRSGVFAALSLVLEKIEKDDEVDIFQVVRTIQIRRPEFFPNFVSLSISTFLYYWFCFLIFSVVIILYFHLVFFVYKNLYFFLQLEFILIIYIQIK